MHNERNKSENIIYLPGETSISDLPAYPVDMSAYLTLPQYTIDEAGIPFLRSLTDDYHPTTIIFYALAHWNLYLTTQKEDHLSIFLMQVHWLLENEVYIDANSSGWPTSLPHPNIHTNGFWMSSITQGCGISVLIRAQKIRKQEKYLSISKRVFKSFEQDILDGGISTPIMESGIFFEEFAVYPAHHTFNGFIFAILGIYDYLDLTGDKQVLSLIQRGLTTMREILDEFDTGFWTRTDLLSRRLATFTQLAFQIELLSILAKRSNCGYLYDRVDVWKKYQHNWVNRVYYLFTNSYTFCYHTALGNMRSMFFPNSRSVPQAMRICVSLPAHPFTGGILTVLEGITQVMRDIWQIEYLTQRVGPNPERLVIHQFGFPKVGPWHFPVVWIYCIAGFWKQLSLQRKGIGYHVLLPQDGVFTSAFAALAGKLIGARVVCIDHSTLTWATNRTYRAERVKGLQKRKSPRALRFLLQLLLIGYWPSLALLARISARLVDHFLIPGIPGDEIGKVCNQIGIPKSHLTRFPNIVDIYSIPETAAREKLRNQKGIAVDAIVVAIVCRLSPEKGLDIAIESIYQALLGVSADIRARVRVIIAGDGPLRAHIEKVIHARKLDKACVLWGEISSQEVRSLLTITDIFLYTSLRGACMAMSVLEAMASSNAVIASTEPLSNTLLLAEGRGVAVPPGDIEQTSKALMQLLNDTELCHQMGILAKNYVAAYHNPTVLKRVLMRATGWSALDELLQNSVKTNAVITEQSGDLV